MSTNPKELNPLEASKSMIEKSKRSTDRTLRALNEDMEQENTLVQDTPNGRLQKVLKICRGIKPVFAVLGVAPAHPVHLARRHRHVHAGARRAVRRRRRHHRAVQGGQGPRGAGMSTRKVARSASSGRFICAP